MTRLATSCVLLLAFGGEAAADEGTLPRPKSAGIGEAMRLRKEISEPGGMPLARVRTRQVSAWDDRRREVVADFDVAVSPAAKGRAKEARAALERVAADYEGHAVAEKAREAIASLPAPKKKP